MASCALFACNGGSGVSADKQLTELDEGERRSLCEYFGNELRPVVQLTLEEECTLRALYETATPGTCSDWRERCLATRSEPLIIIPPVDCTTVPPFPESCTLTVADYEVCTEAWAAVHEDKRALFDCNNAGDPDVDAALHDYSTPPGCEPLFRVCGTGAEGG